MERDVRGGAMDSPAMRDRRTSALQVCVFFFYFNLSPNLNPNLNSSRWVDAGVQGSTDGAG